MPRCSGKGISYGKTPVVSSINLEGSRCFCVIGSSRNSLLQKGTNDANDAHSREDVDCRKRPREARDMPRPILIYIICSNESYVYRCCWYA